MGWGYRRHEDVCMAEALGGELIFFCVFGAETPTKRGSHVQGESNMHRIGGPPFRVTFCPQFPGAENSGFTQEILQK